MVSHQKKNNKNKTKIVRKVVKINPVSRKIKKRAPTASAPSFGPVSTIDTAPVSIGNTVQGCSPIVVPTADGMRVRGRDFLVTVNPTSTSVTGWCVVAGAPITPSCMSASILKGYSNTYSEYQVHGVALHFVTAATTADAGSIMLYVGKDRAGPGLNPSSNNLLPYVLSDHCTVISPVWKNASAVFHPAPKWYTTGLGNDEGLSEQACGELFVLSKITPADSPGYILIDYDITFRNMQVNIKSLTFPITRMKYTEVVLSVPAGAVVIDTSIVTPQFNLGNYLDGVTASQPPANMTIGDIYKVVITTTLMTINNATVNNLMDTPIGNQFQPLSLVDGYTLYAVVVNNYPNIELYPTYTAAITATTPIRFGVTGAAVGFTIHAFISLVGSVQGLILQANY